MWFVNVCHPAFETRPTNKIDFGIMTVSDSNKFRPLASHERMNTDHLHGTVRGRHPIQQKNTCATNPMWLHMWGVMPKHFFGRSKAL